MWRTGRWRKPIPLTRFSQTVSGQTKQTLTIKCKTDALKNEQRIKTTF